MLSALVHSCVRLEVLLDVQLVLFKSQFYVFRISFCGKYSIEVPTNTVLLVVETIKVGSSNSIHVLSEQLAQHAPKSVTSIWLTYRVA